MSKFEIMDEAGNLVVKVEHADSEMWIVGKLQ